MKTNLFYCIHFEERSRSADRVRRIQSSVISPGESIAPDAKIDIDAIISSAKRAQQLLDEGKYFN